VPWPPSCPSLRATGMQQRRQKQTGSSISER
jgi:hypothetical protein